MPYWRAGRVNREGRVREALLEVWERSRGLHGGPGGFGRPIRMAGKVLKPSQKG